MSQKLTRESIQAYQSICYRPANSEWQITSACKPAFFKILFHKIYSTCSETWEILHQESKMLFALAQPQTLSYLPHLCLDRFRHSNNPNPSFIQSTSGGKWKIASKQLRWWASPTTGAQNIISQEYAHCANYISKLWFLDITCHDKLYKAHRML